MTVRDLFVSLPPDLAAHVRAKLARKLKTDESTISDEEVLAEVIKRGVSEISAKGGYSVKRKVAKAAITFNLPTTVEFASRQPARPSLTTRGYFNPDAPLPAVAGGARHIGHATPTE